MRKTLKGLFYVLIGLWWISVYFFALLPIMLFVDLSIKLEIFVSKYLMGLDQEIREMEDKG